jgi:hypothetical protein
MAAADRLGGRRRGVRTPRARGLSPVAILLAIIYVFAFVVIAVPLLFWRRLK